MTELLDRRLAAFDRGAGLRTGDTRWGNPLDVLCALDARTVRTPALELVAEEVAQALATPDSRLIIMMAPQEGKSSSATRAGALVALIQDPTRRVAITSYADRLARRWGRRIRNDILENSGQPGRNDFGLRLAPDQRAADEWELTTGGGVYTAGVGGSLTGRPVDVMIIDDPHKDRKSADSETQREDVWDWWESTGSSRLAPGAPVILILTRWHHDDLAGRLMKEQPGVWRVVHIPAQADLDLVDPDPLGRKAGEFMASARRRSLAQWVARKRDAGDEWEPLYQGNPSAPGGDRFAMDRLRYWHPDRSGTGVVCGPRTWHVFDDCWRFITMDTATSTRQSADWTVASAWAIPPDGSLILLGVARERVPPERQIDVARPLVERWRPETVYVEPSMRSTLLAREAVLEGWTLDDLKADASKEVRAGPAARRVREGRVWFPAGHPLLDAVQTEMRQFPNGAHDDFVDTLAYAALVQHQDYVPPVGEPDPLPAGDDVFDAATDGVSGVDLMRAEW